MEAKQSRYLVALHETLAKLENPVLHPGSAQAQSQCAKQLKILESKPRWSLTDANRASFYRVESAGSPAAAGDVIEEAAGILTACVLKYRKMETSPIWGLLGVPQDSLDAELIRAKECAASLMAEVNRVQQVEGEKVRSVRDQLDRAVQNAAQANLRVQNLTQEVEKLKAEAQTLRAQPTPTPSTAPATAPGEVVALKAALEEARNLVARQKEQLRCYSEMPAAKMDGEFFQVLELVLDNLPVGMPLVAKLGEKYLREILDKTETDKPV